MNFFSFIYKAIFRPIGCLIFLIVFLILGVIASTCEGISQHFTNKHKGVYREYIANGDYEEAYRYAIEENLDITDILGKQTYELLMRGKVNKAHTLCAHEDQMYVYFHALTSNIVAIYDATNLKTIFMAFSMVPYPSPNNYGLSNDFKKQWGLEDRYYSSNDIVKENNRAIESLCTYIKAKGNKDDVTILFEYLQPVPSSKDPDYTDVNRIKDKFK